MGSRVVHYAKTNFIAYYKREPFLILYGEELEMKGNVYGMQVFSYKGLLMQMDENRKNTLVRYERKK